MATVSSDRNQTSMEVNTRSIVELQRNDIKSVRNKLLSEVPFIPQTLEITCRHVYQQTGFDMGNHSPTLKNDIKLANKLMRIFKAINTLLLQYN